VAEEDVQVVRGMIEAFLGDDPGAALLALDPEIVWHGTVGGLDEANTATGHEQVIESFVENFTNWENLVLEVEGFIDAGDGLVVVLYHEIARSRHSDAEVETRTAVLYRVRDGKVIEARGYMDRDQALEVAGVKAARGS
jgi:ketosteroid isomerase-like protein